MKKYVLLACASHILFFSNEVEAGKWGSWRSSFSLVERPATSLTSRYTYPRGSNKIRYFSSKEDKESNSFAKELRDSVRKDLNSSGKASIKACFLGPRAENSELLGDLVNEAVRDHVYWRRNFYPKDPARITEEMKRSPSFLKTTDDLRKYFRYLLADLKRSLPTSSPRYQGHMNWEVTLPSTLGYLAAMLYNQNNVSFEGSPVTTILEEQVGKDLCQMIGYKAKIPSWGHLTCDGSVANIEALWSARNVKFYPLAVKWALEQDDKLKGAREITVKLPTGEEKELLSLDEWSLLNISSDETLALPVRIYELLGKPKDMTLEVLYQRIALFSLQKRGIKDTYDRLKGNISAPVFMVAGTRHYSFPKAVSLLGLGDDNLIDIPVDEDTRIDLEKLEDALQKSLRERRPLVTVSAIMGTTEESSVDPLKDILEKRQRLRLQQGFDFTVYVDAAWGGYFSSLLRGKEDQHIAVPVIPLSDYVKEQFEWLRFADSVTIDPHKTGYAAYPAGALCYRNALMKTMVNFTAPVIQAKDDEVPIIGIYGVEGSKPGASAASVYLSHRVIPLTKDGHGKLLGQTLYGAKLFYGKLLTLKEEDFFVVPLPRLPSARPGPRSKKLKLGILSQRNKIV